MGIQLCMTESPWRWTIFNKASVMKKVLLIVSDGGDNRSQNRLNDIVKRADRAGVLIYTIGLFDENSEDKNPGVLKQLAGQTGGLAYLPEDLEARSGDLFTDRDATSAISTRSDTALTKASAGFRFPRDQSDRC